MTFNVENCAKMKTVIEEILTEYPNDVRHIWKDFPIPTQHTYASDAALAARCADEQNAFWQYHDLLLASQSFFSDSAWVELAQDLGLDIAVFSGCMDSKQYERLVTQGYFTARALNVDTAPSYYINDEYFSGVQSFETMRSTIDRLLTQEK